MKNLYKDIILIIVMGTLYMGIEIVWKDYTDISMMFVGGLCSFLVGRLSEHHNFYQVKMWEKCIVGTFITLAVEFISGLILNVWLNLNIWDYTGKWGSVYGQICLPYAFLWFLLMPSVIFTDNWLRYKLFKEAKPIEDIIEYYKDLLTNN